MSNPGMPTEQQDNEWLQEVIRLHANNNVFRQLYDLTKQQRLCEVQALRMIVVGLAQAYDGAFSTLTRIVQESPVALEVLGRELANEKEQQ